MYTSFQLAKKYLRYYLAASNGEGHGIHSPFVFDFIKNVLRDKKRYDCYPIIEQRRKILLSDPAIIEVEDFGAGSAVTSSKKRVVKDIARSSLKSKKYAQLLYRMAQYYQPKTILELGTSFGITTSYLASANQNAAISTCEGAPAIAAIARQTFDELQLKNILLTEGDFTKTLPQVLSRLGAIDFAFIDGNHQQEPTLQYFQQLLSHSVNNSILVFDDIHWSGEMELAWKKISGHAFVTLTLDLFFIGIVFINADFKVKQHFAIRF